MENSSPGERRPLKSRNSGLALQAAIWLARRGVTPNAISLFSIVCGALSCGAFVLMRYVPSLIGIDLLYLVAIIGIQSRLLCNLLDGMVAVEAGHGASRYGEIYNDLPDRVTDILIFAGAGISAGGRFGLILGLSAAIGAILTAYVRVLGKSIGAKAHFVGPTSKPHRMAILTVTCILCGVLIWINPTYSRWTMLAALSIISLGCILTCINRLRLIYRDLEAK